MGLALVCPASAQTPDAAQLLERLQRLEKNQAEMQKQLDERDKRIDALEEELRRSKQAETPKPGAPATVEAPAPAPPPPPVVQAPTPPSAVADLPPPEGGDATPYPPQPVESASAKKLGSYRPPRGFFLTGNDQWGEINFGIYTYVRFLEQKGLEDDATNGPSEGSPIDKREDLQLAKVKLEFRGWFLDPRFQYTLYTWTNQNAQGQGAQVVVGGNLNWVLDPRSRSAPASSRSRARVRRRARSRTGSPSTTVPSRTSSSAPRTARASSPTARRTASATTACSPTI
jgi:hypothetical protein